MDKTNKQQALEARRNVVMQAYNDRKEIPVTNIVKVLAKRFKVTEVTIYADIEKGKKVTVLQPSNYLIENER